MEALTTQPIATDDHGNQVYPCHFTGRPTWPEDAVIVGGTIPNAKARYVMHRDSKQEQRQSAIWFHESEANCNTCASLTRTKHAKRKDGMLEGTCPKGERVFHPDDPMDMPCYTSRWAKA